MYNRTHTVYSYKWQINLVIIIKKEGVGSITPQTVLTAFVLIGVLLIIGKYLRLHISIFQKYFIPTSLIAGLIGLILKENLIQKGLMLFFRDSSFLKQNIISENISNIWKMIPGIFITFIFASLFLGKEFKHFKKSWEITKSQIAYAQTVSWGQYVIGFLVTLFILVPFFNGNVLSSALIEISFEGGHGTASGMRESFIDLGFEAGADIALGMATFGILSGIISGIVLINWGIRKNKTQIAKKPNELSTEEKKGIYKEETKPTIKLTTRDHSISTISLHFAFILLAVGIGMVLLKGLVYLENITWANTYDVHILSHIPLFPIAMLGGVILQLCLQKAGYDYLINRNLMLKIQNFVLDILIVAAISSISLTVISNHFATFIILSLAGFLWNLGAFLLLAPKIIYPYWFERGLTDYGQSMGMTTTGLLLLQIVDPEKETPAFETYGYIQLFFEPLLGGGIVTAASLPLIAEFGPYTMFLITGIIFLLFLSYGFYQYKKRMK